MATSQTTTNILLLLGGVTVFLWVTLPPQKIAFDRACEVKGLQAHVSEMLHGDSFWRAQLEAAIKSRQWQERLPAEMAHWRDDSSDIATPLESKMSRLSSDEPRDADEQQKAEAAAQRQRLGEIAWLTTCESAIRTRLED
ncbi:MAG TPA: hypothetical protein VK558_16170 [Patescibacteria group bacterium]|nr:hypothetical protein [Patescibacteria group bacterium]